MKGHAGNLRLDARLAVAGVSRPALQPSLARHLPARALQWQAGREPLRPALQPSRERRTGEAGGREMRPTAPREKGHFRTETNSSIRR